MRITRLSVTPIKGTALQHPQQVRISEHGADGDRAFFIVGATGHLISIWRTGAIAHVRAEYIAAGSELRLQDGARLLCCGSVLAGEPIPVGFYGKRTVQGHLTPGPWDNVLSDIMGQPVRLVRADAPGAGIDAAPVTMLGTASVAELAARLGQPVDPRRFRMLLDLETSRPHEEDAWSGATLVGDEVRLRVGGPVPRCAAVTRDPDRGAADLPVLHAIKDYRGVQESDGEKGVHFGVYATVLTAGTVSVGEDLRLQA